MKRREPLDTWNREPLGSGGGKRKPLASNKCQNFERPMFAEWERAK